MRFRSTFQTAFHLQRVLLGRQTHVPSPVILHGRSFSRSSDGGATAAPVALIFDTETTGLVNFSKPGADPCQPGLIQLGMILVDTSDWTRKMQTSVLVQLEKNVSIHPKALETHGISEQDCNKFGVPLHIAAEYFFHACRRADVLVAHNIKFDVKVMEAAAYRGLGIDLETGTQLGSGMRRVCTMDLCTNILKLPKKSGKGYKWPTLSEAYAHFTDGKELEGGHDALVDAEACLVVFQGMVESGALVLEPAGANHVAEIDIAEERRDISETVFSEKVPSTPCVPYATRVKDTLSKRSSPKRPSPMLNSEQMAKAGELVVVPTVQGFIVSGQTYKHKEALKSFGGKWEPVKKVWAFPDLLMLGAVKIFAGIPVLCDETK